MHTTATARMPSSYARRSSMDSWSRSSWRSTAPSARTRSSTSIDHFVEQFGQDDLAVEDPWAVLVADPQGVAVALGDDQRGALALAFEQRVRGDGRAHPDLIDLAVGIGSLAPRPSTARIPAVAASGYRAGFSDKSFRVTRLPSGARATMSVKSRRDRSRTATRVASCVGSNRTPMRVRDGARATFTDHLHDTVVEHNGSSLAVRPTNRATRHGLVPVVVHRDWKSQSGSNMRWYTSNCDRPWNRSAGVASRLRCRSGSPCRPAPTAARAAGGRGRR